MIHVSRMKKAWWISRAIRGRGCLPTDVARQQRNRTLTLGAPGLFMRAVASGLLLNAVFPTDALAQTRPTAVTQQAPAQPFSTEQLDALVASIALYPDDLLTQLLMASTFPLEVVTAARWVEDPAHKPLSGDALAKALEAEPWDPSVKSLVPFPVVLATLNGNLTWLQQLGYAFATQQADVFAAVQRLRRLAQANDKLQSSPQQVVSTQQVTVEPAAGSSQPPTQQEVIVIQPAQPNTVYVPSYNPATVYGSSWPYPSYPPYYAAPPSGYVFRHRAGHRAGICGRRRGRGRAMGFGESWVGRRLCERQRQPIQQHQRQPVADHFEPLGRGRWEWAARQFRPRARRTGGPSRPFASLRSWQCGAASDTSGRSRRRRRYRRRWSAGRPRWLGVSVPGRPGGLVVPVGEARAGLAVLAALVAQGVLVGQVARAGLVVREVSAGRVVPVAQEPRPDRRSGPLAAARASAARNVRAHSAI